MKSNNLLMRCLFIGAGLLLAYGLLATFSSARAESEPGSETSEIEKPASMPNRRYNSLLAGRSMGLAHAAEMNGYPGPMHVLELAEHLEITDQQRQKTVEIMQRMRNSAQRTGKAIIATEGRLEALFDGRRVQPSQMDAALLEIANLTARLRATHLRAHIEQTAVLNAEQIENYMELRSATETRRQARRNNRERNRN